MRPEFGRGPKTATSSESLPLTGWIRLQGFELRKSPCIQSPGFTLTIGADPLLGFHLPGVFSPPATTVPNTRSPLTHLGVAGAETAASPVPQSLNEQDNRLVSLETADPSEVFVLVSFATDGSCPFRARSLDAATLPNGMAFSPSRFWLHVSAVSPRLSTTPSLCPRARGPRCFHRRFACGREPSTFRSENRTGWFGRLPRLLPVPMSADPPRLSETLPFRPKAPRPRPFHRRLPCGREPFTSESGCRTVWVKWPSRLFARGFSQWVVPNHR
jgi:hypothetical protein